MNNLESAKRPEIEHKAKVLIIGIFTPEDIEIIETGKSISFGHDVRQRIEETWIPLEKKGYFPGPLMHLNSATLSPKGKLVLSTGETNFKEYTGTRSLEALRTGEQMANPLSASTTVITKDNKLIIAQRKKGDAPQSIDAIGGYVHPTKDKTDKGKMDVFQTAYRELMEETGISTEHIEEIVCLGLAYEYAGLCHPNLSFAVKTSLTSEEVLKLKNEEIDICVVDADKLPEDTNTKFVLKFLREKYPFVEPDGRITIALTRKWAKGTIYPKRIIKQLERL